MYAQSHAKQTTASLVPFLRWSILASLGLFFCAETGYGMEEARKENGEKTPLARGLTVNTDDIIHIDGGNVQEGKLLHITIKTQEFQELQMSTKKLDIELNLLEKADPRQAQVQISTIADMISLLDDETLFEEIKEDYIIRKLATSETDLKDLKKTLLEESKLAISPLAKYLKERREQSDRLIELTKPILEDREKCESIIQELPKKTKIKKAKENKKTFNNHQLNEKNNTIYSQTYGIPAITFIVGACATASGFLVYYYYKPAH